MRKLATIRRILSLDPIEGADAIEVALVDGWRTVVKKGEFRVGDLAVYFEIDSWIPKAIAPFLFKGKSYEGVEGARLQTVRLRGQISQGLLLPMSCLPPEYLSDQLPDEGFDASNLLGVRLWEPPPPKQQGFTGGRPAGNFPPFLRKTDQERIQNLRRELGVWAEAGEQWEVTEKLDGTSFTAFRYEGRVGVCSRNFEIKPDAEGDAFPGLYWQVANETGLLDLIPDGFAVQGEIVGPGIQGNKYQLHTPTLFVFDVFDIARQRYLFPQERRDWLTLHRISIQHVPILVLYSRTPYRIDDALTFADGLSVLAPVPREGLVFKHMARSLSWKAISNAWLLKFKA